MKIAIFSICLGKYDVFFEEFYASVNELFLPGHSKQFFIFSDQQLAVCNNVRIIPQKKLGWPHDTMMRFHFLNRIKADLQPFDYIYFFNINMKVLEPIGTEVVPGWWNHYLMGCKHPLFFDKPRRQLPYERNSSISCAIPHSKGKAYYQGCFNGGRVREFLAMSEVLASNIDRDLANNLIPVFHDESQLNWYYKNKRPLTLPYTYIFPEGYDLPGKPKMIQRDKWKLMDRDSLRS